MYGTAAIRALFSSGLGQEANTEGNSTSLVICQISVLGFAHHGNCNLLCRPALWTYILVFFFGHHIAHGATILSRPGQSKLASLLAIVTALVLPGGGIWRDVEALWSRARLGSTDLQVAARAGALCTVVKNPKFDDERRTIVSRSDNILRIGISDIQLFFASSTLYRIRGDQSTLYGYAAFGWTVVPYAWMSFVHLVGNLLCSPYDTLFIVESRAFEILRDYLKSRGIETHKLFQVNGTVGHLTAESELDAFQRYWYHPPTFNAQPIPINGRP